ncbi:MAG: SH3 domain-containing protein [bacterium]|nr:SH3 domain-containing protein [bacterium]
MLKLLLSTIIFYTLLAADIYAADQHTSYPMTQWCIAFPVLRVRDMPSTEGDIVDKIPYGTSAIVLGEKSAKETISGKTGRWVEIQFRGRQGYAFDAFFSAKEPAMTVEGLEKKTAALVNSFKIEQDRCDIELVDAKGKAFFETADSAELCKDELPGKRVKISYGPNKACQKGSSCPAVSIHDIQVIPLR